MEAEVLVHSETTESGQVWWAESLSAPGFSAAADTLGELRARVKAVLEELAAARGEDLVETCERLVPVVSANQASPIDLSPPDGAAAGAGSGTVPSVELLSA